MRDLMGQGVKRHILIADHDVRGGKPDVATGLRLDDPLDIIQGHPVARHHALDLGSFITINHDDAVQFRSPVAGLDQ